MIELELEKNENNSTPMNMRSPKPQTFSSSLYRLENYLKSPIQEKQFIFEETSNDGSHYSSTPSNYNAQAS